MDTEKLEKELEKILIEIPECSRCVLEDDDCRILTITDCRILKIKALFAQWAKDKGMVELDEENPAGYGRAKYVRRTVRSSRYAQGEFSQGEAMTLREKSLRVLVACEFSGVVRRAFRARGHEAYSCDILPSDDNSPYHIQDDVLKHLDDGWDLMIAHPPCTRLCNSGVRWLDERDLWKDMRKGAEFFKKLMNSWQIPKRALENPIPHKYALAIIGKKYDQIIQPYYFGDKESKATCLWLFGLPPLMANFSGGDGIKQSVFLTSPGPDRAQIRSRTFEGIAEAMASQWSPDLGECR